MVNSSGAEGGAGGGGGGGGGDTGIDGGAGGSGGGTQHPAVPPTASGLLQLGCGPSGLLTLHVTTTTGRNFSVIVDSEKTVVHLKKVISKNLKVSKDRICLLHRERVLHDGTLRENGLVDGAKIILTPNVETGLLTQRAEQTVMQALESLNDKQVNDFLSGKSPLNLSVRLGDHMMLIQLQLSTLSPSSSQAASIGAGGMSFSGGGRIKASIGSSSAATVAIKPQHLHRHHHHHHHRGASGASPSASALGHAPKIVGSLALGGHKAIGNNQQQQSRHPPAQVPASATNSKANMLARRPVASSVAPGDAAEDGLEQPALKRPAGLESNRESESAKTLPQSGSLAATSKLSSCDSNALYKSASRAKNNIDHCTGENNNSNANDSNISNITTNNRSAVNIHEDQQQGKVARIQPENEEMEHEEEKRKGETNNEDKLAHILASESVVGTSNNLQTTAPIAVSSPIKSLSKLVSARMMASDADKAADGAIGVATADLDVGDDRPATADVRQRDAGISECSDPITANLTSCLCRRLDGGGGSDEGKGNQEMGREPAPSESSEAASSTSLLHRTALNPIAQHKAKLQGMGKKTPTLLAASAAYVGAGGRTDGQSESAPPSLGTPRTSGGEQRTVLYANDPLLAHPLQPEQQQNAFAGAGRRLLFSTVDCAQQNHQPQHQQIGSRTKCLTYIADPPSPQKNPALVEASRNLTQTLRKLSRRVFTGTPANPMALSSSGGFSSSSSSGTAGTSSASTSLAQSSADPSTDKSSSSSFPSPSTPSSTQSAPSSSPGSSSGGRLASSGAVIEYMKHHGKGIYSGTFSGTLNPALQDKFGRPKRDISTIIHILNDLLSATPQCATSEANADGSSTSTSSTSSSNSSATKIYFDPTSSPADSSVVATGNNDASSGGFVVAGSPGGSSPQRHSCHHHYQGNRNSTGEPADGGSNTSWFVPAPPGSKKSLAEETKNVSKKPLPESGLASPNGKCGASVATGIEEDTLTASGSMNRGGMLADGACVGCKLPSGSTDRHGGGSSSGYRSLLLSSLDGSTSCTKFVPLSPLAASGSSLMLCQCGSTMLALDDSSDDAVQPQQQCELCIMKAVEMENSKTKHKLDSLRLIMKQKRERREARKLQSAPYHSTVGAVSPRTGANDTTPRSGKTPNVPVNTSSHNPDVTAAQKRNEVAVGIKNNLPEHQQSQHQRPGHEEHDETETLSPILVLKETAQLANATCQPTEQDQLVNKSPIEGTLLQNTHPEEPTINSSATDADVPFSNATDTGEAVKTDDTISSDPSKATEATPKEPSPPSATDAASSASTDASTNTGATHLVEEVDSVA